MRILRIVELEVATSFFLLSYSPGSGKEDQTFRPSAGGRENGCRARCRRYYSRPFRRKGEGADFL